MSHERRLQPAVDVLSAHRCQQPHWIRRGRARGAFAAGIRYEKQALSYLVECTLGLPNVRVVEGPWYEFQCREGKVRHCQPDAVLFNKDQAVGIIVEVKLKHTPDSWWQLQEIYRPVLRVAHPDVRAWGILEICHWHDPATKFPQRYDFTDNPLVIRSAARVSVHIYNPRRARLQQVGRSDGASSSQADGAGGHA